MTCNEYTCLPGTGQRMAGRANGGQSEVPILVYLIPSKKYPAKTGLKVDFFVARGGINFVFSFGEKLYQENHSIAPFGAFFFVFQQIFEQAQYLFPDKKARLMPGN